MEFSLNRTVLGSLSYALDAVSEQPVDIDFTLPDYCPDIEKILRCKLTPKIYSRTLSGGRLQIDGNTVVNILYVNPKGNTIRACEQTVPFSAVFQLKETPEDSVIETKVRPEYLNCRALSPRRLTVHGAFSVCAKVISKDSLELCSPASDGLEQRTRKISCSALSALCQEEFTAGDELQIGGKPPVEVILDSSVQAHITDLKLIPDKLMLNGELAVRILYLSDVDGSEPQTLSCVVPFSRVVDCPGLSEDTEAAVGLDVLSFDVRLKSDILSETPVVDVDARLCLSLKGYTSCECEIVTDAFSTEYPTQLELRNLSYPAVSEVIDKTVMHKDSLSIGDTSVSEIIELHADCGSSNPTLSDGKLNLASKINVCLLGKDNGGEPVYIERVMDAVSELDVDPGFNQLGNVSCSVISLSYRIGENNTIELRIELRWSLTPERVETTQMVCAVTADEEGKLPKRNTSLTLYYADAGESLWDIAKSMNIALSRITDENQPVGEWLEEARMLLIPTY